MARMPVLNLIPTARWLGLLIVASVILSGRPALAAGYDDLIRRGNEAREAGELPSAIKLFREAIDHEPENATAYVEAADTYLAVLDQNGLKQLDFIGRSLWLPPHDWKLHADPPYRFSLMGEPGTPTEAKYDGTRPVEFVKAQLFAARATELAPDDARAWRVLGMTSSILGERQNALSYLRRATELEPSYAAAWAILGGAHLVQDDHASALRCLDMAVRLDPSEPDYWSDRAACRLALGDLDCANDLLSAGFTPKSVSILCDTHSHGKRTSKEQRQLVYYAEKIRLGGYPLHYHHRRIGILLEMKDFEAALAEAELALSLDPQSVRSIEFKFSALHCLGQYEAALDAANQGRKLRPYSADFEFTRALALEALGRHDEARAARHREAWLTRWMAYRPKFIDAPDQPEVWLEGGRLALEGAEYEAAKTCFDEALSLDPDSPSAYDGLARLHLALEKPQDALAAIERAIELDPNSSSLATRAEVHLALGDFNAAIADYESAMKTGHAFGPQVADAYLRRAEHREANGDTAGAAADRKHAEALRANPFGVPSE